VIRASQGQQWDGQIKTHPLVLVEHTNRAQQSVGDLREAPGFKRIRCLESVPDVDRPALDAGALVFVFPLHDEGYGIRWLQHWLVESR
jgi:glycosyltransferase involved in cell wall biosynthesis